MELEVQKGASQEMESAQTDLHRELNILTNKVSIR